MIKESYKIILIIVPLIFIIVSCGTAPNPGSGAQNLPAPMSLTQTCDGWSLHLYKVKADDMGNGWIYYTGNIAIENNNAQNPFDYSVLTQDNMKMVTSEGFVYQVLGEAGMSPGFNAPIMIPVGYRYTGYANLYPYYLSYQAAKGSTGHFVKTPCGTLDYDNPEINFKIPTDLSTSSFTRLGTSIKLSDGSQITFSAGQTCSSTCIDYSFENANKGYAYDGNVSAEWIQPDGRVATISTYSVFPPPIGPGATVNGEISDGDGSPLDLLILMEGKNFWVLPKN